jgi:acetoin utilization deacetylase AcuC-like enzyme
VLECAGTLLTGELALAAGVAVNLAGGTHHAHFDHGAGYTIINDLALTAGALSEQAIKVLIVDCDVHQGDGTAQIVTQQGLANVMCLSLHGADNYPHPKAVSTWDMPLPSGTGDAGYLDALQPALAKALEVAEPSLVLYDAGVDVYEGDSLGKLALSEEGIQVNFCTLILTFPMSLSSSHEIPWPSRRETSMSSALAPREKSL